MISVRLPTDIEDKLNKISKYKHMSKSDIIKRALELYFAEFEKRQSPYELGKDLFGKFGNGNDSLSQNYKQKLKDKLNEKFSY